MLSTTIIFKGTEHLRPSQITNITKQSPNYYVIYGFEAAADKPLGHIFVADKKLDIQYSDALSLEEYKVIHDVIVQLQQQGDGEIDDRNSFLGYLPNGESVYMMKNWEKWLNYIESSMKNCQNNTMNF